MTKPKINSIFSANGINKQLPDSVIDNKIDIGRIPGLYKIDDEFHENTIYCKFFHLFLRRI